MKRNHATVSFTISLNFIYTRLYVRKIFSTQKQSDFNFINGVYTHFFFLAPISGAALTDPIKSQPKGHIRVGLSKPTFPFF